MNRLQTIHMSGTNCSDSGCNTNYLAATTLHTADGTPITNGDVLAWRQYQDGSAIGGILLYFGSDGTGNQILKDTDGQFIDTDTISNRWHERVVDLSSFAGKTLATVHPWMTTGSGPGAWNMYFGDIVLVHANGTSIPIYSRSMTTLPLSGNTGVTGLSIVTEKVPDPARYASQTYYSSSQIGSTQTLTTYAGWPVSYDTYYPFGQEATPTADNNHYKFTGKERDTESGLDYFGARYYSSATGRWMSPDWAAKPEAVPYSDLENPQSLNLYGYVNNNPLSKADKDGHCAEDFCIVEGSVTAYFAGAAVLAGAGAYLSTPAGQRSLNTFTSAAGASFSSSFHSLTSIFSKSESATPAPAAPAADAPAQPQAPTSSAGGETAGQKFTPSERAQDAGKNCVYCGRPTTEEPGKSNSRETDHGTPRSQDGNRAPENRNPSCRTCNRQKGTKTPEEFKDWQNKNPDKVPKPINLNRLPRHRRAAPYLLAA